VFTTHRPDVKSSSRPSKSGRKIVAACSHCGSRKDINHTLVVAQGSDPT
jgi:hypothetical protein